MSWRYLVLELARFARQSIDDLERWPVSKFSAYQREAKALAEDQ